MALCRRKHYHNLLWNIGSKADHVDNDDDDDGVTIALGVGGGGGGSSSSSSSSSSIGVGGGGSSSSVGGVVGNGFDGGGGGGGVGDGIDGDGGGGCGVGGSGGDVLFCCTPNSRKRWRWTLIVSCTFSALPFTPRSLKYRKPTGNTKMYNRCCNVVFGRKHNNTRSCYEGSVKPA